MTKVASEILKGKNPFDAVDSAGIRVQGLRMPVEKIENIYETEKQALPEFETKKFTDIPQMDDWTLITHYNKDRDEKKLLELLRRSKNQPFIVLEDPVLTQPGFEKIDARTTYNFLRKTRRELNMDTASTDTGDIPIYRASEFLNRTVNFCPDCRGALCRNYCKTCNINFDRDPKERVPRKITIPRYSFISR